MGGAPHFICANSVWKSIRPCARRSRQVTDPIEQLDAGSFISLTRQIKKRERKRKVPRLELRAGRWGGVKHPQVQVLLAQGHGTESPGTLGIREMAPGLLQGQSLGFGIVWEEGTGLVQSPASWGQA